MLKRGGGAFSGLVSTVSRALSDKRGFGWNALRPLQTLQRLMDWFLSHYVHNIDAKGRVSVPAAFRQVLSARSIRDLFAMRSLTRPNMDVGGAELIERFERRMASEDPLSDAFQDLAMFAYGDGVYLKFDTEGRITMTDFVREHTGIVDKVCFVGARDYFQLWEPGRFEAARDAARASLRGGGGSPTPSARASE